MITVFTSYDHVDRQSKPLALVDNMFAWFCNHGLQPISLCTSPRYEPRAGYVVWTPSMDMYFGFPGERLSPLVCRFTFDDVDAKVAMLFKLMWGGQHNAL
jgi:hypothetical protein